MLFNFSVYESPIAAKTDNSDKVKIYHFFHLEKGRNLKYTATFDQNRSQFVSLRIVYPTSEFMFGYSSLFDEFV
jgi:hypothetical protein